MKSPSKPKKPAGGGNSKSTKDSRSRSTQTKRARSLTPGQFIDIVEHISDGLVVLDKDWHYVYLNQKAAVMLQRQSPAELIGKHIWTEYPEGLGQPFQLAYEKAVREQTPIVFEDHYKPWDLWFENRIYPSSDHLIILFTEITDRKRIERLLSERQYFLQKVLDTEPGTVYIYDLEERRNVYINRHWLLAYGYSQEETQAMGDQILGRIIHPEDLLPVSAHHEGWRQADEGDVREVEYRVRTKTGEWRWLHSREVAFARDENGQVKQILGVSQDVTEGKQAERALRESEEKFSRVFYASPIPLSISRLSDWRYVEVNESFLSRLGYRREEIIGQSAEALGLWINPAGRQEMMHRLSETGSLQNFETQFHTKTGNTGTALLFRDVIELSGEKYVIGTSLDITERKEMEKTILKERDFSDAILNSLPGIFYFYDQAGNFLRWNTNFEAVSGYSAEEMVRRKPMDFFAGAEKDYIAQKIQEVFATGASEAEANLVTRNGERIPYYFTGRRIDIEGAPYLLGVGIDIGERKRAEEALAASEVELRALFASMNDVVLVIDRSGVYRKIAPTNPDLLYRPPKELLGKTMREIFPEEQAQSFLSAIQGVVETHKTAHIEYQLPIDEQVLWFEAFISPMDEDTVLWVVRDITGRKRAEENLQQLNQELEQRIAARTEELAAAMVKAQESDRLKSAFLAAMSHELRTPLNSIIGFSGVILQGLAGPLNAEQSKQLGMVRDSARHLLALINDVLDISKIEAGQLEISRQPFDMRQAVESALRVVHPLAQKKNLQMEVSFGPGVGMINNDRRRVEQVLINLVNNAIKFSDRGRVRIECQLKQGWLETRVHDEGIGIKPEHLDRLFKPFQQIDTGLARGHEGTGLGLAICKRLVTAMGGEIQVESRWEAGSIFTFTLPV